MKKVIVVEDEMVLLKALSMELLGSGYSVLTASDGKAGLALIKSELPDIVLLDIQMPKMNGYEVLTELKKDKKTKAIPVIILSNMGQDEDKAKGMELGAADYYIKSATDLAEISKKVKKVLKK